MKDTLDDLQGDIKKFVEDRDWSQFHNYKDLAISLLLEATEVLEHFQWKPVEELDKYVEANKKDVAEELADVLYWLLLISSRWNIDLAWEFHRKMEINNKKYPIEKAKWRSDKYNKL